MKPKILITMLALSLLPLAACSPSTPPADTGSDSSVETTTGDVNVTDARVIAVDVKNFSFTPAALTMKKGEKIVVQLKGQEGSHGFAVPDLGINVSVSAGQTVDVDIPTDKAGTFSFQCSIPCGSGHQTMRGTIVIE